MKIKTIATVLGIALVGAILALLFFSQPTVVERPVVLNRYIQDPVAVPVYVQPGWWGAFGSPWGYKTGYDKPWKMGSGLPGMKVPPPPPPGPSAPPPGPAPSQPPPPPSEPAQPPPSGS